LPDEETLLEAKHPLHHEPGMQLEAKPGEE
jgi:hypothetical protein